MRKGFYEYFDRFAGCLRDAGMVKFTVEREENDCDIFLPWIHMQRLSSKFTAMHNMGT